MKIKEFKSIELEKFITLASTKKDLHYYEILLNGTVEETQMLEVFCTVKMKSTRRDLAWGYIIYHINEKFHSSDDITYFFTEKTLNFLIENEIELISLGHLKLSDEWLLKIYEKDNRCTEALQTVELRKQRGENKTQN